MRHEHGESPETTVGSGDQFGATMPRRGGPELRRRCDAVGREHQLALAVVVVHGGLGSKLTNLVEQRRNRQVDVQAIVAIKETDGLDSGLRQQRSIQILLQRSAQHLHPRPEDEGRCGGGQTSSQQQQARKQAHQPSPSAAAAAAVVDGPPKSSR